MRAFLLWPVAMLLIVVGGFTFALNDHRQRLNEELQRADQESAALQQPQRGMITKDVFPPQSEAEALLRSYYK